jgi:hypothetical protein
VGAGGGGVSVSCTCLDSVETLLLWTTHIRVQGVHTKVAELHLHFSTSALAVNSSNRPAWPP